MAGRIVRLSNFQGQSRTFVYNDAGALVTWTDALNRTFSVGYDSANAKAVRMIQTNGNLRIVRNSKGAAVLEPPQATAGVSSKLTATVAFGDGWQDPFLGEGLLGSFSGFTRYAVRRIASTPSSKVPPALAAMLVSGSSDTYGDDGGDGGDDGDSGDDGAGDDDDDYSDDGDSQHPDCQPCEATFHHICSETRDDAIASAQDIERGALLLCVALVEIPVAAAACVAAALIAFNALLRTAKTGYNNCVVAIPQNCYSQCH